MHNRINHVEDLLKIILQRMEKNHLIPEGANLNDIKEKILEHLQENDIDATKLDLNKKETQKLFVGVVLSVMLGIKNDDFTKELKHEEPELTDKLDKQLGHGLALTSIILELREVPNEEKLLEDIIKPTLEAVKNGPPAPKPEMQEQQKADTDLLMKQAKEVLFTLYGTDIGVSGAEARPVMGGLVGNLLGFTNQTSADPTNLSYMVESITYHAGSFDPTGKENIDKLDAFMQGVAPSPELRT